MTQTESLRPGQSSGFGLQSKRKDEIFASPWHQKKPKRAFLVDQNYVCVDNMGRLIRPGRLTYSFCKILKQNNLKHIRFHDLRHSCASIMLSNGVPMKQIQEWLGHADFGTTANIYSHLDYKTKQNSANTISNLFNFDSKKEEDKTNEIDKTKELEEKIAKLEEQLKSQQEDEEYLEWLKEKEMRKKKKQKDFEM